ncbi:hypothetical protein K9L04_00370 [Patescibacteria group bacterium]|nr:hypothetical protein [Patescibacteria group bacterium]
MGDITIRKLINPFATSGLSGVAVIQGKLGEIIASVFGILGIILLVLFVYGGAMMLFSMGKPDKFNRGVETLKWAVIGIIIIFLSYSILIFIFNLFPQIISSTTP